MKKIVLSITIITILLNLFSILSFAQESTSLEYSEEVKLLQALGIMEQSDEQYKPNDYIVADDFMKMIHNIVSYGEETSYELNSFAKSNGFIMDTTHLSKASYVTYDFATKVALNLSGHQGFIDEAFTNEFQTLSYVRRLRILDGLNYEKDKAIKNKEAIRLIYNTLFQDVMEFVGVGVKDTYHSANYVSCEDYNVMNKYMNIYEYAGILTATYTTAMYGESSLGKDEISIDKYTFNSTLTNVEDYVGRVVKGYYIDETGRELIAMLPDEDYKSIVIYAEEVVEYNEENRTLTYQKDDNKTRKINLSKSAAVISNNRGLENYEKSDFLFDEGYITFSHSDDDSLYDVANIKKYNYVIVDNVTKKDNEVSITNKISFDGNVKIVADDDDIIVLKDNDGNLIEPKSIARNGLLEVIYNKNAVNKKIEITYVDSAFDGIPNAINSGDNEVYINGNKYEISDYYISALDKGDEYAQSLALNRRCQIYTNPKGRIVAVQTLSMDDFLYGYLKIMAKDKRPFNDLYRIKVFEESGYWKIYDIAEKLYYNNQRLTDEAVSKQIGIDTATLSQMIAYRINSDGEIIEIMTAQDDEIVDDEQVFRKSKYQSLLYRSYTVSSFGGTYFSEAGANVFLIPDDGKEENFMIVPVTSLVANDTYNVCGYNPDRFKCYDFFSITIDADTYYESKSKRGEYFVINDVSKVYSEEFGEKDRISGITGFMTQFSMDFDDGIYKGDLKRGDVIKFCNNSVGDINYYIKVFDIDSRTSPELDNSADGINKSKSAVVKDIDYLNHRFLLDDNGEKVYIYGNSSTKYVVYEEGRYGIVRNGLVSDMEEGDIIYASANYGFASNVYIIKQ